MDYLSFCPSLVDILLFVEPDDILKCKVVNRRFHDIILRNSKRLPRYTLDLVINTLTEETTRTPFILLSGIDLLKTIYITPQRTILIECPKQIFELYRLHEKAEETTNENTEEELIMQKIHGSGFERRADERMRIYQHERMEDGLRTIWTYIFSNYNCTYIDLKGDLPSGWLNLLTECCGQLGVRCNWIGAPCTLNGIRSLVESTGCSELRFSGLHRSEHQLTGEIFMRNVKEVASWNTAIKIDVFVEQRDVRRAFSTLLQTWCTGEWSLDEVALCCRIKHGYGNRVKVTEFTILGEFEAHMLGDAVMEVVHITEVASGELSRAITIKRNSDNRLMVVSITVERSTVFCVTHFSISEQHRS